METVTLTFVGQDHTTRVPDILVVAQAQFSETADAIDCNPPCVRFNVTTEYQSTLIEQARWLTGHVTPRVNSLVEESKKCQ